MLDANGMRELVLYHIGLFRMAMYNVVNKWVHIDIKYTLFKLVNLIVYAGNHLSNVQSVLC